MPSPMTAGPSLSLVIPVYNAADQLPATLAAVDAFAARYPDSIEIVFVDDHSTDVETQRLLEGYARRRPYARVLRNSTN
ncbi:MAG TPA: glycosyltransferase, partial [Gemmatimonadaceae bacterium]|nr:glycosyltransferase [Gemmatimonadaceae bacterium]